MKVYFWDFHGVLEEGSPATLVAAINEQRLTQGMFPDVSEDEIAGYFGPSLPEVLERFFPGQDTKTLARVIGGLTVKYTPEMMRAREGAISVLNRLYQRGDLNYVVSSADGNDILEQIRILGFSPYLHGIHTFLLNGNSHDGSVADFKAGVMVNAGLIGVQRNYGVIPEGLILIGDTETDMRSVELTREMVSQNPEFSSVPVHGALFDPYSKNSRVRADYRLRRLEDVLYI